MISRTRQGKTQVFLQARLRSARLPQKALLTILGKSIMELIVERLRGVQDLHSVVLVTGEREHNEELVQEAERIGIAYFCGSEENVLDRFYQASKMFSSDAIVRVTGDCPLIDPCIIDEGIRAFRQGGYDIVGNTRVRTFPDGMDFEVFSSESLAKAWNVRTEVPEGTFVHPTKHMLQDSEFQVQDFIHTINLSHIRLTVDYEEDFDVMKTMYEHLYPRNPNFSLEDILDFLKKNPQLLQRNKKYITLDYGLGE